jgi:hypothetical protein
MKTFFKLPMVKKIQKTPLWLVEPLETPTPPIPFPPLQPNTKPQILQGIKVLELCRIIAGPTITRTLAEYGAEDFKITSPDLSDVPFFQVDGYPQSLQFALVDVRNAGKITTDLNLKPPTIPKFSKSCCKMSTLSSTGMVLVHLPVSATVLPNSPPSPQNVTAE